MKMYLGMDVHCKQTVYVVQDEKGKNLGQGQIETTQADVAKLVKRMKVPKGTEVGFESGTQAIWMSRVLTGLGMKPIVISAQEVRAKARKKNQKSDYRDAHEICDGIRTGMYRSIVFIPDLQLEKLRRALSRRRHFVKICTQEINAAKFLVRSAGIRVGPISLTTGIGWEKFLAIAEVQELKSDLERHNRLWLAARQEIRELEKEIEEASAEHKSTVELLQTMPGIGPISSTSFVAAIGDPRRFETSGRVASYLGLVPSTYDSGEVERHGHITKSGPPAMRSLLCEAAHSAARVNHPLNPYFVRQCARGGYKKAVVSVAHRMARILYQMWRKGENFDEGKLNVVHKRMVKTKVVHYQLKTA
jgi:transposase